MNSFKYNQIENKIRQQFKEGTDYSLTEKKERNHTSHTYQIKSPQLEQVIQNYLQEQSAILMQFEFKGRDFTGERIMPDNSGKNWKEKYNVTLSDENGDGLHYGFYGEGAEAGFSLSIQRWDKPEEGFNQKFQTAKKAWEAKGSPLNNTPPSGVKCWSCYEVISDADIAAGRYKVENNRFGKTQESRLVIYKTFEHVKEHGCKAKEYDVTQRNNYWYRKSLKKTWLEYPQKRHEYSCQDCLNKLWNEVNSNLIYLETWAKEQVKKIAHTKQILAEISARLAKLQESGQFHNCGIKKYGKTHDKPNHSKPINNNKGLIGVAPVEREEDKFEKFQEPQKPTLDKQTLLNWMKEKGIVSISLDPNNSNKLLIEYEKGKSGSLEIASDLPQEWGQFLRQEVSRSPITLDSQNSQNETENKNNLGGKIAGFSLLAVGLVVGIVAGMLIYRQQKLKKT